MTVRSLELATPAGFSFPRTALSHGWCMLPPFRFRRDPFLLERVLRLPSGRILPVVLSAAPGGKLRVAWEGRAPGAGDRASLLAQVRHMLRLDEDLDPFYRLASARAGFEWIARAGAGRLLRSPTVFEDLVKLICTTNCTWALTEVIVGNLVESLGEPAVPREREGSGQRARSSGGAGAAKAFPTPEAMAGKTARFYEKEVRAGYRARALAELAGSVASGRLDVEGWLLAREGTAELKKQILSVRGAGPYTAENLLKLLGRYEGLALDSWCRAKFSRLHPRRVRGGARAGTAGSLPPGARSGDLPSLRALRCLAGARALVRADPRLARRGRSLRAG